MADQIISFDHSSNSYWLDEFRKKFRQLLQDVESLAAAIPSIPDTNATALGEYVAWQISVSRIFPDAIVLQLILDIRVRNALELQRRNLMYWWDEH